MSFPLRALIDQYKACGLNSAENEVRGEGAECIYAFFVLLGVKNPVTGDLSENLIKRCAEIMAEDLPSPVFQLLCKDLASWLSYIYQADYCHFDWSQCLDSAPRGMHTSVMNLKSRRRS